MYPLSIPYSLCLDSFYFWKAIPYPLFPLLVGAYFKIQFALFFWIFKIVNSLFLFYIRLWQRNSHISLLPGFHPNSHTRIRPFFQNDMYIRYSPGCLFPCQQIRGFFLFHQYIDWGTIFSIRTFPILEAIRTNSIKINMQPFYLFIYI